MQFFHFCTDIKKRGLETLHQQSGSDVEEIFFADRRTAGV